MPIKERQKILAALLHMLMVIGIGFSFVGCSSSPRPNTPKQPDTAAFGAAHFGMSKSDFINTLPNAYVTIENSLFDLKPLFDGSGRLYELMIESQDEPFANYKTTLDIDIKTLINKMISLYGNPTGYHPLPESADFLYDSRIRCFWRFPNKNIDIFVWKFGNNNGSPYENGNIHFRAVCRITNIPMQQAEQKIEMDELFKNR